MHLILGPTDLTTELEFTIPTLTSRFNEVKRIGVFVSGGLDAVALLCLIASELKVTNRLDTTEICVFTIVKNEGSTYYAQRIVDRVSDHFKISITHVNNVPNDSDAYINGRVGLSAIQSVWEKYYQDTILYMAINQMAPDSIRPFEQTLKINYKNSALYQSPFLFLHKPQILDILYKLGCDDIIQYTHSCTVQAVGTCGNCYSCKEREWGFTALGKDPVLTVDPDVTDISFGGTWRYIQK